MIVRNKEAVPLHYSHPPMRHKKDSRYSPFTQGIPAVLLSSEDILGLIMA